jgi:hypothetical protein
MRIINILLLTVSSILTHFAIGQTSFSMCAEKNITTGNENQLDSFTNLLINKFSYNDFYLIGEAHTFLANNDFQFSLIKILHKYKVYNVANELPHSTCFIFNQYLETGNDSLLTLLKPSATYNLLKKVREFNLAHSIEERVKYYGIDYMDAKYDYGNFYVSLKIIREKILSKNLPLDIFLDKYLLKGQLQYQDVIELKDTLSIKLESDSVLYKKHFGFYYDDLLLMASNIVGNRTNRDADIFKSFSLLYRQLSSKQKSKPKFIAFYGMGHLNNFGNILLLNNKSPVKNSVCKIGIQYINCLGGWTTPAYINVGLYQITKNNLKDFVDYCKQGKWQIGLFTNTQCFNFRSNRKLNAIIIFKDYGDRKMNSWKFD